MTLKIRLLLTAGMVVATTALSPAAPLIMDQRLAFTLVDPKAPSTLRQCMPAIDAGAPAAAWLSAWSRPLYTRSTGAVNDTIFDFSLGRSYSPVFSIAGVSLDGAAESGGPSARSIPAIAWWIAVCIAASVPILITWNWREAAGEVSRRRRDRFAAPR